VPFVETERDFLFSGVAGSEVNLIDLVECVQETFTDTQLPPPEQATFDGSYEHIEMPPDDKNKDSFSFVQDLFNEGKKGKFTGKYSENTVPRTSSHRSPSPPRSPVY